MDQWLSEAIERLTTDTDGVWNMKDEEIAKIAAEYGRTYPAMIDFHQAGEIAHCPMGTLIRAGEQ